MNSYLNRDIGSAWSFAVLFLAIGVVLLWQTYAVVEEIGRDTDHIIISTQNILKK